jgi:hypothetical protein
MQPVSKTVSGSWVRRGFKSLPLRFVSPITRTSLEEKVDLEVGIPVVAAPHLGVPAEQRIGLGEQEDCTR